MGISKKETVKAEPKEQRPLKIVKDESGKSGLVARYLYRVKDESGKSGLVARCLRRVKDESGSAVLEFVALALPLFVPVIIFLSQFATSSNDEFIVRTLARETVRAYILSSNDLVATYNAQKTMEIGARELGLDPKRLGDLGLAIDCAGIFCISPENKVEVTITLQSKDGKRVSSATARETVSPWV